MGFSKEDYEQKYERMWTLMEQQINIFKEIIADERVRADSLSNAEILELKDATK